MHTLLNTLNDSLKAGLQRKTIKLCSDWATSYRVMGEPFPGLYTFDHHPWAKEMHDAEDEFIIGQKGAQLGFTEVALNKAFYSLDFRGKSVLYVLPAANPDAGDFSKSRFDPALELSDHLNKLFSDVKNVGHKRAGSANLFIRGSRSRSQLKSLPVDLVIADEIEEMVQSNIALIPERLSGREEKQMFFLSTPSVSNVGINRYYKNSSEDHFYFRCPCCSRWTELVFPECLVVVGEDFNDSSILQSHLICKECHGVLPHATKHEWLSLANTKWVASYTNRMSRGFHISQLYSFTVSPGELAIQFLKGQRNPSDEQEFYNSKLGLPHEVEGARVTDAMIDAVIGHTTMLDSYAGSKLVTMGVDVGKWLHYEICEWTLEDYRGPDINLMSTPRVIKIGKTINFEDLDALMRTYHIQQAVIDANPERRKAMEFAQRFWGHVRLCFYGRGINNKTIVKHADDEHTITVDRTSWLDLSLARFRSNQIVLPMDVPTEYREHIKSLIRVYQRDQDDNPIGKYVKDDNDDDHYAHARNYAEIALPLGLGLGVSTSINEDF